MSNSPLIKVEGLSKQYLLNKQAMKKSDTLYGNFIQNLKTIKKMLNRFILT